MSYLSRGDDSEMIHCAVCRKLIEVDRTVIAEDLSECCSDECANDINHQHCNLEPCRECMENARQHAEDAHEWARHGC